GHCPRACGQGLSHVHPAARQGPVRRARRQVFKSSRRRRHARQARARRALQEPLGYPLAIAAGILLALSFPRYGHPAVAWIALVPLLIALSGWRGRDERLPGQPPRRAFTMGLLAGFVYFVGTVYWTSTVVATYGNLPAPVAVFAMVLLALYLALFPALMALVTSRLVTRGGAGAIFFAPAAWVA